MILSDRDIIEHLTKKGLVISPRKRNQLQPASVDLRLSNKFRVFDTQHVYIDPKNIQNYTKEVVVKDREFILHPGEFVLSSTVEWVGIPDNIVGRIEGKSSLGRIGLLIHATAGFIDPGFNGNATLELSNVSQLPILLHPGMFICQISFSFLSSPANKPYGSEGLNSKYQNQSGPQESKVHENFQ